MSFLLSLTSVVLIYWLLVHTNSVQFSASSCYINIYAHPFGFMNFHRYTSSEAKTKSKDILLFINGLIRFEEKNIHQEPHTKAFKQWTRHEYGIINSIRHMINGQSMAGTWMTQNKRGKSLANQITKCYGGWCLKSVGNSTSASYKIHQYRHQWPRSVLCSAQGVTQSISEHTTTTAIYSLNLQVPTVLLLCFYTSCNGNMWINFSTFINRSGIFESIFFPHECIVCRRSYFYLKFSLFN